MAYTLYAPPQITVRTADLNDIELMLGLPKLARFIPDAVLANPAVIANRRDTTPAGSPTFVRLRLEFDADEIADIDELERNVSIWAQRCRIMGVRGQRLAVVSEAQDLGDTVMFEVLIGTVVFYNERRVTVGVSLSDDELRADLSNMFDYVPVEPSVDRIDADGNRVQVLPVPVATTVDPSQNLPQVSLDQVVLSLIRLGTESAPLLVNKDAVDVQMLRDHLDNLQLELAAVRAQLN